MKGKLLPFLILPVFIFALFLLFSPVDSASAHSDPWQDTSVCTAVSCGTTEGTKTQATYKLQWSCPTVTFTTSRLVEDVAGHYIYTGKIWEKGQYKCPSGYQSNPGHTNCRQWVDTTYKTEVFSLDVLYGKSMDPNKCHKPTPDTLNLPSWTRGDYGKLINELSSFDKEWVVDQTRTVSCTAPVIACEGTCPSICGYEGGTVPDGKGGTKVCPATEICPAEGTCPITCGYEGGSVPDGNGGTKVCPATEACPAAGTCPTACGLESSEVPDGNGGTILCAATQACPAAGICPTTCGQPETEVADGKGGSMLCPATEACPIDTDGEVLGTTDVVTAETAGGLDSYVYLIQSALILMTGLTFATLSKEYLKK